jgi:hypothetical protein
MVLGWARCAELALNDAIQRPPARERLFVHRKDAMVNETFLLSFNWEILPGQHGQQEVIAGAWQDSEIDKHL